MLYYTCKKKTTKDFFIMTINLNDYRFECSCGERFLQIAHAVSCRKCRVYSLGNTCLYVVDRSPGFMGELVYGRFPTEEEVAEYEAIAAIEREETRRYIALCEGEGELYEQIVAERAAADAVVAAELAIDQMYMVQDELSGY